MTNLGTAYVSVMPSMQGFGAAVESGLSGIDTKSAGSKMGQRAASGFAGGMAKSGIIMGAASAVASRAMDAIASSTDRAISRVDTMANFPKVMKNLGISSEDAQAAVNKVSEGLDGLPTALDAGVASVQRFTSFNGDVSKSADMFLAVNDAILAGGMSAGMQASALEQLSQAYTKGKMDMMEWRSMQQTMPAQLKMIADSMDMTVAQLGAGLRQNKKDDNYLRDVSMDEFIDQIMKLDKEGGKGLASFKQQAADATTGIGTAMANLNTRVAKGVATLIEAVGQENVSGAINAFSSNIGTIAKAIAPDFKDATEFIKGFLADNEEELGNLASTFSDSMGQIHDKAREAVGALVDALGFENAGDAINALADGISDASGVICDVLDATTGFIKDNDEEIGNLVKTLGSMAPAAIEAWAAFKVLKGGKAIFSGLAGGVGGMAERVRATGKSFDKFGTKMGKAGLLGAGAFKEVGVILSGVTGGAVGLVAGVGLGIAALTIYNQSLKNAAYEAAGLSEEQKQVVDSAFKLADSYGEMKTKRDESIGSVESEFNKISALKDEYNSLIDANGNVKAGYEGRADVIKGEIADALGIEKSAVDELIDSYGRLGQAADESLEKRKAQKLLEAEEEQYKEALAGKKDATVDYTNALEVSRQATEKSTEAQKAFQTEQQLALDTLSATPEAIAYSSAVYGTLADSAAGAADAAHTAADAVSESGKAVEGMNAIVENHEGLAAALDKGDANAIQEWSTRLQNSIISAENGTRESLEEQVKVFETNYENMKQAAENGVQGLEGPLADAKNALDIANNELANYNAIELNEKFASITLDDGSLVDTQGRILEWNGTALVDKKTGAVVDDAQLITAQGEALTWNGTTLEKKTSSVIVNTNSFAAATSAWSGLSFPTKYAYVVTKRVTEGGGSSTAEMARGGFVALHSSGGFITGGITDLGLDRRGIRHIAGEAGREWIMRHADGTTSIVPIQNKKYLKPYANVIASMIGGERSAQTQPTMNIYLDGRFIAGGVDESTTLGDLARGLRRKARA